MVVLELFVFSVMFYGFTFPPTVSLLCSSLSPASSITSCVLFELGFLDIIFKAVFTVESVSLSFSYDA